jgi:hypothetical protein
MPGFFVLVGPSWLVVAMTEMPGEGRSPLVDIG